MYTHTFTHVHTVLSSIKDWHWCLETKRLSPATVIDPCPYQKMIPRSHSPLSSWLGPLQLVNSQILGLSNIQPRSHYLALGPLPLASWWSSVLMITHVGIHVHTHCAHSCFCRCWQQSCMFPGGTQSHCSCWHSDLLKYPRAQNRDLLTQENS